MNSIVERWELIKKTNTDNLVFEEVPATVEDINKTFYMKGKIIKWKILVKEIKPEEKTSGGIYRPGTEKSPQITGEVIKTGKETEVQVGEKVIFSKFAGLKVNIKDEEFLLLNERDVLYRF